MSGEVIMDFKERLVELAKANVEAGGRPFSASLLRMVWYWRKV
jgi:hypothetical protein